MKIKKIAFFFFGYSTPPPIFLPSGKSMLALCIYEAVLLFLFTCLVLYIAHISEITHYLVFLWFILISVTPYRNINVVTIAKFGYFLWLSVYIPFLKCIYPSVDTHILCVCVFFFFVNNASINKLDNLITWTTALSNSVN